jgi:hypothetical protein
VGVHEGPLRELWDGILALEADAHGQIEVAVGVAPLVALPVLVERGEEVVRELAEFNRLFLMAQLDGEALGGGP